MEDTETDESSHLENFILKIGELKSKAEIIINKLEHKLNNERK